MPLLPQSIVTLVEADGQPREAHADDGSQHMLWREDGLVRSCLFADWPSEQPRIAQREQGRQEAQQLRQAVRARLDALAGKRVDDLLVGELKTLLLYLIHREGGIDRELKIRPIGEWGR